MRFLFCYIEKISLVQAVHVWPILACFEEARTDRFVLVRLLSLVSFFDIFNECVRVCVSYDGTRRVFFFAREGLFSLFYGKPADFQAP